jgi:hypothetical protein
MSFKRILEGEKNGTVAHIANGMHGLRLGKAAARICGRNVALGCAHRLGNSFPSPPHPCPISQLTNFPSKLRAENTL